MTADSKGRTLFIVDNSISGWTGIRYLEEWSGIARAFDVATGYFEIGALLALDGKWQALEKLRILMGAETTPRTRKALLEAVQIDYALFAEDLAGKNGPLISPRAYEEFWYPYQDSIVQMLRDAGVPVICQWSAGQFGELLPSMMDHGFNCTWPLEAVAGMDALELRRTHGRGLLLGGNIPKEAVIEGPGAIDREIDRLMPLIREGGFIPAMDDMAPMECPFSHYRHMVERLQAIRLDGGLSG